MTFLAIAVCERSTRSAAGPAPDLGSARACLALCFKSSSDLLSATGIDIDSIAPDWKLNDRMEVIGPMNFAALDLNLLRVFDAMAIELNTTRAGERVGLSQPAVSAALGRLRHIVGDELFVREGNRMVATPRALMLREPIREALRQMEYALSAVARFEPAAATQVFRISGSDYFSALLMPRLAAAVTPEAPGVTLQMLDHPTSEALRLLGESAIDMGVDARFDLPEWVCSQTLFQSFIVSVARRDHPALAKAGIRPGARIPPEIFCAIPQVLMSMDGGRTGTVDPVLADRGLKRQVAVTVPHFQAVALTVAEAGLLGSLPIHFARPVARLLGLDLYLPPFDPPIIDVILFWHRRVDGNAANAWLRDHIIRALDFGPLDLTVPLS
jgi:DNA-binding transcriptional LysR family regulator